MGGRGKFRTEDTEDIEVLEKRMLYGKQEEL
jgi:hypothetical protein